MKKVKINKKFIILLIIFLLFVFCCKLMNSTIEGAENKDEIILSPEELKIITDDCNYIHDIEDAKDRRKCISNGKAEKIKIKRGKNEAKKLKDEMGVSSPGSNCPEVNSFYNLFAKAYCLSNNIRKSAQNV